MTLLLLLAATTLTADPPGDWKFVDAATRAGRPVVTYRSVELAGVPAHPLHAADKPPAGAAFGSVGLGPGGRRRLAVVWHAATSTLWFDADGDGRFAPGERHALGTTPVEAEVAVPSGDAERPRTVLLRKRGDGVAWAVRGYTEGAVTLAGKRVAALLTDGDADGCFDGAGVDRVWLDLDGDGAFDPLTEQFVLGHAITANGTAVLVKPRPDGLGAVVRERPTETGTVRVEVARLPGAEVVEFTANYVSEFGELVAVGDAGKAVALPAGKYRVDSAVLKLAAADGTVWHYWFSSGSRTLNVEILKGKPTTHALFDDVKVTVAFGTGFGAAAAPGAAVQVQPDVTAGDLYLTKCETTDRFSDRGREVHAEVVLTEPGSVVLDRCESGFV